MASTTVIDAARLARLGISGDLAAALTGLTIAAAAELMLDDLVILLGDAGAQRAGVVSYAINGRSVSMSFDQAETLMRLLRTAKSGGGGPEAVGVMLA